MYNNKLLPSFRQFFLIPNRMNTLMNFRMYFFYVTHRAHILAVSIWTQQMHLMKYHSWQVSNRIKSSGSKKKSRIKEYKLNPLLYDSWGWHPSAKHAGVWYLSWNVFYLVHLFADVLTLRTYCLTLWLGQVCLNFNITYSYSFNLP
jgi:hypothetical protein